MAVAEKQPQQQRNDLLNPGRALQVVCLDHLTPTKRQILGESGSSSNCPRPDPSLSQHDIKVSPNRLFLEHFVPKIGA